MIKQNDKQLLPDIQKVGCFVRSCGAIAEFKTKKELTAKQINDLWTWAKKSGNVDYKNCVKHSAPIINKALEMLDGKGKFFEIATFKNGKMGYYGSVSEEMKKREKWYIQKIAAAGSVGTHFRVIDYKGDLLFDPYEPTVKPLGIFYSIVYAYKEL